MKLGFGRVVPPERAGETRTTAFPTPAPERRFGRVAPAELLAAAEHGRALLERAEAEANALLERARAEALLLKERAAAEGRAEAAATLAARELALTSREQKALETGLDDSVELARLLAERLLGEALAVEPGRIAALARQALTEANGAKRVTIVAHPDDVPLLERALLAGELAGVASIASDAGRARGSLRLETNVGTLDAELAPQLERLAARVRESLGHD
jgi:flagellar biosynthesis/type III secretory pathway protein FliH